MIGTDFVNLVREYTNTDVNTLPLSTIVLLGNTALIDLADEIVKKDENYFGVPAFANLRSSLEADYVGDAIVNRREYPLDVGTVKFLSVAAKFDGVNYVPIQEDSSLSKYIGYPEDFIISKFANVEGMVKYCKFRNSLWIFSGPITAVTSGLKMLFMIYPAPLTTERLGSSTDLSTDLSATSFSLPLTLHELWARKVSITWKETRNEPIALTPYEQQFNDDLKNKMEIITNPNLDRVIVGKLPSDRHLQ